MASSSSRASRARTNRCGSAARRSGARASPRDPRRDVLHPLRNQLRPDQPLGQLEIRGMSKDHYVNVHLYFGTPEPTRAQLAEADRQLGGLVIRRASESERTPARTPTANAGVRRRGSSTGRSPAPRARRRRTEGVPVRTRGQRAPRLELEQPCVRRGGDEHLGSAATAVDDHLAWVTAGAPSPDATVVGTLVGFTFPMRSWGTVAVNRRYAARARSEFRCRARG